MKIDTVHSYEINGLHFESGDIICTSDGDDTVLAGQFWRLIGRIIPGDVDHIAIYTGPKGRCVEANGKGVEIFEVTDNVWDAHRMKDSRGGLIDKLYGAVYPLQKMYKSVDEINVMRINIANYCLEQAERNKPYNLNFIDSANESAFYCSQLAYCAYKKFNIDLNTGMGVPNLFGTDNIIFPQEIWNGFPKASCI